MRRGIVLDRSVSRPDDQEGARVGEWAKANNVGLTYVPFYASWINRIEAQSRHCGTSPSTAPTTRPTEPRPG